MDTHKHIQFKKRWEINSLVSYQLGECDVLIETISNIPLRPRDRERLLQVSLIKGAVATTAIEGNTLSEEEVARIQEGWKLPPSKEYLEIEVRNIMDAFNTLFREIVVEGKIRIITPELIRDIHQMVGKDLGEHFDAIPGKFRTDSRFVGTYVAPDYRYVEDLVSNLCKWLPMEFHFQDGQSFAAAVIQAIVTHVYIEWIHPFGDGNGRTGRLLEFYILLRAGLPSIVSHILSNFYNETRTEYYRQLDKARKNNDLTEFIIYAVQGFRDGLKENIRIIQKGQFKIFWHNYIYEAFNALKYTKRGAFKRKRDLMLEMPIDKSLPHGEIVLLTPKLAQKYANVKKPTLLKDLRELIELGLMKKEGNNYRANIEALSDMMPI